MKREMTLDRLAWETAEALAPSAVKVCADRVSGLAFWRVQLAIYKALLGVIPPERCAERILRAMKRSEREIARSGIWLEVVEA